MQGRLGRRRARSRVVPVFQIFAAASFRASGTGCCTWWSGRWSATARSGCRTTCCCGRGGCRRSRRGSTCWRGSPAERIGGIYDRLGVPIAAVAGFVLAGARRARLLSGIEVAQAAFVLLLPLAVIAYSKLRLALAVRRRGIAGPALVLALARRRIWHQFIAVLAMLGGGAGGGAASADPLPPHRRRSRGSASRARACRQACEGECAAWTDAVGCAGAAHRDCSPGSATTCARIEHGGPASPRRGLQGRRLALGRGA